MLYTAVKAGRTVVYHSEKAGIAVFKNGKAYGLGRSLGPALLTELPDMLNPNTLYLRDGGPPLLCKNAFPLVVTSPKKQNWHEFSKSKGISRLVIPAFNEDEIEELRSVAFGSERGCDREAVSKLFAQWGGNVRNVLTMATNLDWQNTLDSAATSLELTSLRRILSESVSLDSAAANDNIHRLVNLVPRGALPDTTFLPSEREYFSFHHAELASSAIEEQFAERVADTQHDQRCGFLNTSENNPTFACLRGNLYERYIVIPRLRRGPRKGEPGELRVSRLSPAPSAGVGTSLTALLSGVGSLDLRQPLEVLRFRTPDELKAQWDAARGNAVFLPTLSNNFPVIDMVLRLNGKPLLANATISSSHPIKVDNERFLAVLDTLGLRDTSAGEIPFLWFLPVEAFERFNKQGSAMGSKKLGDRLAQYKVLLPVL